MWNWYGAALAKNTSQNPDSVLRLHVIAKIKVHFAHYRLHMKEGWEISCVVPSNYFEAIVPSQCASHCNADIFTFELARSSTAEPGFLHCVHLGSMERSRIFIFPQQGTCTEASARTGVGVGTSGHGLPFTCSTRMEGVTCASPETPDSLQGLARHSYIQSASRNTPTPSQSPSSCTVLFLFSPVGQIPTLFTIGKCPICKMWVG